MNIQLDRDKTKQDKFMLGNSLGSDDSESYHAASQTSSDNDAKTLKSILNHKLLLIRF